MLRACLHENLLCPKIPIKHISVVWSYYIVDSIAVFFLYLCLSKHEIYKSLRWWLLNFWSLINFQILWKTNIIFSIWKTNYWKSWRTSSWTATRCRDFAKQIMLFLVKHNSIFVAAYYTRKNIFPFTDFFSLISWGKKTFEQFSKISVYNQPVKKTAQSQKNTTRAKALFCRYWISLCGLGSK